MPNKKTDAALAELLTGLYTLQEDLGAKPKTSDEQKRQKAEQAGAVALGTTKKAQATGTRFLQLKHDIIETLQVIHEKMKDLSSDSGSFSVASRKDPKEVIKIQHEIRELITEVEEKHTTLEGIYKKEIRKRKSKFTAQELELQHTLVRRLGSEIEKVKGVLKGGFGSTQNDVANLNTKSLASLDESHISGGVERAEGAALNDKQQQQLEQIDARDKDFDKQIAGLGEGLTDLLTYADQMGDEVKAQSVMLDKLEERIDDAAGIQTSLNQNVKDLLDESGRGVDKLCIDVTCILMMIGFISGMFQISSLSNQQEQKDEVQSTSHHPNPTNNNPKKTPAPTTTNLDTAQTRHYLRRNSQTYRTENVRSVFGPPDTQQHWRPDAQQHREPDAQQHWRPDTQQHWRPDTQQHWGPDTQQNLGADSQQQYNH